MDDEQIDAILREVAASMDDEHVPTIPSPSWEEEETATAMQTLAASRSVRRQMRPWLREREAMRREALASLQRRSCKG